MLQSSLENYLENEEEWSFDNIKINKTKMTLFWKYIAERHSIYKKKEIEKVNPPWTEDRILTKYKFTNVFRDLDPGTKFVIETIIPKLKDDPANLIFNCIIYRLYNKIETFNAIGFQDYRNFDPETLKMKLREQAKLQPVFTGAFIVSGYGFIKEGNDKIAKTCILLSWVRDRIEDMTEKILKENDSEFTYKQLKSLTGIGEFLGYQIAVDLGYWNKEIFDEDTFTVAGPGARRGINRLFEDRGPYSYEECIGILCLIQDKWFERINVDMDELFSDRSRPRVNLMAMENCLCEISKYLKAKYGEGRPRNRYKYEAYTDANLNDYLD